MHRHPPGTRAAQIPKEHRVTITKTRYGSDGSCEQVEVRPCAQCRRLFAPKRPSQVFCCTKCRSEYHVDHGASGTVAGVRRIHRGASIVIHLTGPAAEAAMQLLPGQKVRLVDAP